MTTFQVKGGVVQSGRWKGSILFCRSEWAELGLSDGLLLIAKKPFNGCKRVDIFDLDDERWTAINSKPFKGLMPLLVHSLSLLGFDPVTNLHFYVGVKDDKDACE